MVAVDFVDRWIKRWRNMRRVSQQRSGLDRRTISGEQQITGINVLSLLPRLISDIPELVILSRRNRRIANLELDQRVRMWPRRQNLTSTRHPGLGIVGVDDVADGDVGDFDGGSVSN